MKKGTLKLGLMTFLFTMGFLLTSLMTDKVSAFAASPAWWKGSAQEYTQLVENAKKEGNLLWYDSLDDKGSNMVIKEFNKIYPFIGIEHIRTRGVESRELILRELRAGVSKIDVLEVSDDLITTFKELKMFQTFDWDKKFQVNPVQLSKDNTTLKVGGSLFGFAYNTNKVTAKEAPKTWEDLLDPKWKNKKLGADDRPKAFIALVPGLGEQKVIEYLKKLTKQDIIFKTGTTAGMQMLAAGEFSVYVTATFDSYQKVKSKGAQLEFIVPNPAGTSFEAEAVVSKAPHTNAAILFLGWMASGNGGQEIRDKASNGEGLPLPGFNTASGKFVKNINQLSICSDEWLPKRQEIHKKLSEAMGFKI